MTNTPGGAAVGEKHRHRIRHADLTYGTKLRHIVVVVMENRTVDDLFQNFPNADTQNWGLDTYGEHITLTPEPLDTSWDPVHSHLPRGSLGGGFAVENDNFKNDGWANEAFTCNQGSCPNATAYAYVKKSDVKQYYDLGAAFTFSDEVYETNEGPSYVAHQYLIAGQANGYSAYPHLDAAENPTADYQCAASNSNDVGTVDLTTQYPGVEKQKNNIPPREDYETIFDLVDTAAGGGYPTINWKSYVPATTVPFWNAPMSIEHLYELY